VNAIKQFIKGIDGRDVLCAFGLALGGYGLFLIYPPAAFIVPGTVMVALAVFA
jgi:hypothetical protein